MDIKHKQLLGISLLLIVTVLAVGSIFFARTSQSTPIRSCTMEARLCADGTSVGRTGPNCEFSACPSFPSGVSVMHSGTMSAYHGTETKTYTAFNELDYDALKVNIGLDSSLEVYPSLDFSKEFIFAIALGDRSSGGYMVKVTDVVETAEVITVSYQEVSPGNGCFSIEMITQPYVVLRMTTPAKEAMEKEILFKSEKIIQDCHN